MPTLLESALAGGLPGMAAMAAQVTTLMWMRTTMNYQYKYGGGMGSAMKALYAQGGVRRFYSGYGWAMVQGPLSRFGDTAANAGAMAALEGSGVPIAAKTLVASTAAAGARVALMPVDTIKTMMQVEGGSRGWQVVRAKVGAGGARVMFHGAMAASAATFAGHYPWYTTYNYLDHMLPGGKGDTLAYKVSRSAGIGLVASLVSDTVSNSLRVVKTAKQTADRTTTYTQVVKGIIEKDGVVGLMGRGLQTRLYTNCLQGLMFSVLWRLGQDMYRVPYNSKNT